MRKHKVGDVEGFAHEGDRIRSWRVYTDQTVDRHGETERFAYEFHVSHSKHLKSYVVSVDRIRVTPNVVSWAMELRNEDPCPFIGFREPTARYSAKRLDTLFTHYLHQVAALHDELVPWANRAKG